MTPDAAVQVLESTKEFFDRGTGCFAEEDSGFAPQTERFTVAQQVAHVAQTVDWFVDGTFGGNGFDMDFDGNQAKVRAVTSLAEARSWWERAMKRAAETFGSTTADALAEPIPNDNIMGGAPRGATVGAIADHTAHHRGALAVYARLAGKEPPMPYG